MSYPPTPHLLTAALAAAFNLPIAAPAWAAAAPDTTPSVPQAAASGAAATTAALPAVSVTGKKDTEHADYVAKRGVTATKTDTSILETPQSISVVNVREMQDKGLTTLTAALAQTPSVTVNNSGFDARDLDWVVIRGFDAWYSGNFRDGLIQTPGITYMGTQTEVYGLERIEILRGPASALFGKGDVGGVVNRVSKTPDPGAAQEIMLQLGSHGRKQLAADLGGTLDADGHWQYRLVGVGLDTATQERYPDGTPMKRKRQYIAPSLRWEPSAATALILQGEYLRDDASDDVQFINDANGQPTRVKEGDPRYSRITSQTHALGYQFEHRLESGWLLRQKLRHSLRTMDKHHVESDLDGDGYTLHREARHDKEEVLETTVDTSAEHRLRLGPTRHTVLVGMDWDRSRSAWRKWMDPTASLDMNHPVYGVAMAEPVTPKADVRLTSTQLGWYVQDQARMGPHWGLTLSARRDRVRIYNDDRLAASATDQRDAATTSRAGLDYQVGNGWAPYASYANAFVPNVGVDHALRLLRPSRGRQYEVGIKYIPSDTDIAFTAAVFDIEKTNVITYDPKTNEAHQVGKVSSRGLELEAKAALSRQWRFTGSFSVLNMKTLASANPFEIGKVPPLTPEQTGSLWLDYAFAADVLPGVSLGGGLRYQGKRWNDQENRSSEPPYTLVDIGVRYATGPWRLAVNVSNLLNKKYYSGRAYNAYFGEERSALMTASYKF